MVRFHASTLTEFRPVPQGSLVPPALPVRHSSNHHRLSRARPHLGRPSGPFERRTGPTVPTGTDSGRPRTGTTAPPNGLLREGPLALLVDHPVKHAQRVSTTSSHAGSNAVPTIPGTPGSGTLARPNDGAVSVDLFWIPLGAGEMWNSNSGDRLGLGSRWDRRRRYPSTRRLSGAGLGRRPRRRLASRHDG